MADRQTPTEIPTDIRELLSTRVDTFEKLDLVVALHGATQSTMTFDQLIAKLGCSRQMVHDTVRELRRVLLVDLTSRGEVQLVPPTEAEREIVRRLVELHDADRSVVSRVLGEIALGRIRGMAARVFGDAFVLGRKKTGGNDDG